MLFLEFTRLFGWAKTLGLNPNGLGPLKSHTQLSEDPPISTDVQQSQSERELRVSTNFSSTNSKMAP